MILATDEDEEDEEEQDEEDEEEVGPSAEWDRRAAAPWATMDHRRPLTAKTPCGASGRRRSWRCSASAASGKGALRLKKPKRCSFAACFRPTVRRRLQAQRRRVRRQGQSLLRQAMVFVLHRSEAKAVADT